MTTATINCPYQRRIGVARSDDDRVNDPPFLRYIAQKAVIWAIHKVHMEFNFQRILCVGIRRWPIRGPGGDHTNDLERLDRLLEYLPRHVVETLREIRVGLDWELLLTDVLELAYSWRRIAIGQPSIPIFFNVDNADFFIDKSCCDETRFSMFVTDALVTCDVEFNTPRVDDKIDVGACSCRSCRTHAEECNCFYNCRRGLKYRSKLWPPLRRPIGPRQCAHFCWRNCQCCGWYS